MNDLQLAGVVYLILINLVGLITAFSDKRRAQQGKWRVRERTFLLLSLFGGGIGVLTGFYLFRHKTKHAKLVAGVFTLAILSYIITTGLFLLL